MLDTTNTTQALHSDAVSSESSAVKPAKRGGKKAAAVAPVLTLPALAVNGVLPLSMLCRSAANVRTRGDDVADKIPELAAVIAPMGLINPLCVIEGSADAEGRFPVAAGDRRFRALQLLASTGRIRADEPIEVRMFPTADALHLSLAENSQRLEMHPVDECEAFRKLVEVEGRSLDWVAGAFGVSTLTVRRRLALSKIAPKLLDLYRSGKVSQEQLQALALIENHETQVHVWESAPEYARSSYHLRSIALASEVAGDDERARFVGIAAYEAAGGHVRRDLFSNDDSVFLADAALLDRLCAEKIEAQKLGFIADGWMWAEQAEDSRVLRRYHRAEPSKREMTAEEAEQEALRDARIAEANERAMAVEEEYNECEDQEASEVLEAESAALEEELTKLRREKRRLAESLDVFSDEARAMAGVVFWIGADGSVVTARGMVRDSDLPADPAADAPAVTRSHTATAFASSGDAYSSTTTTTAKPAKAEYSERVIQDLSAHRTGALMAALLDNERAALATLVLSMLESTERGYMSAKIAQVGASARLSTVREHASGFDESRAGLAMNNAHAQFVEDLGQHSDDDRAGDGVYAHLLTLDLPTLVRMLTFLTARSVDVIGARPAKPGHADRLAEVLGLDMADYWQAGAANFFVHVPKAKATEAVTATLGAAAAENLAKLKKAESASEAEKLLQGHRWLPAPLCKAAAPTAAPAAAADDQDDNEHQDDAS